MWLVLLLVLTAGGITAARMFRGLRWTPPYSASMAAPRLSAVGLWPGARR